MYVFILVMIVQVKIFKKSTIQYIDLNLFMIKHLCAVISCFFNLCTHLSKWAQFLIRKLNCNELFQNSSC